MPFNRPSSTNQQATQTEPQQFNNDLAQSKYNFDYMVFPQDLSLDSVGHYMIINVNVPIQGSSAGGAGVERTAYGANYGLQELLPWQRSKVDTLRFPAKNGSVQGPKSVNIPLLGRVSTGINTQGEGNTSLLANPRNTRRIAESIALHMPTPLVFNSHNVYQDISLTALAGEAALGAATVGTSALKAYYSTKPLEQLRSGLGSVSGGSASEAAGTVSRLMGYPINPAVEILFATTPQRQFVFEVLMAPRNEKESQSMYKIIKTLRFHGAPEIDQATAGATWIPPAEFDITFFNKGVENFNIIRVNTCVLERVEVDYAPTGVYSTFRDGSPVAVRLSLGFRELEPIHKLRILQGF